MNKELKRAIIDFVFEHTTEFQLHNVTVDHFRQYIYSPSGEYIIGGARVYKFIEDAIDLITNS